MSGDASFILTCITLLSLILYEISMWVSKNVVAV